MPLTVIVPVSHDDTFETLQSSIPDVLDRLARRAHREGATAREAPRPRTPSFPHAVAGGIARSATPKSLGGRAPGSGRREPRVWNHDRDPVWSSQFNPATKRTRIDPVEFPVTTWAVRGSRGRTRQARPRGVRAAGAITRPPRGVRAAGALRPIDGRPPSRARRARYRQDPDRRDACRGPEETPAVGPVGRFELAVPAVEPGLESVQQGTG